MSQVLCSVVCLPSLQGREPAKSLAPGKPSVKSRESFHAISALVFSAKFYNFLARGSLNKLTMAYEADRFLLKSCGFVRGCPASIGHNE
jgi:hypothetical protein